MKHEELFLLRDRASIVWFSIALLSSLIAVALGLNEVYQQRQDIAELVELDREERAITIEGNSGWGSAVYYTFHLTYDPPSDFVFAAFGERDVSPWKHRIRMLAIEGQIYESDADNPDFASIGRFDFAFVAGLLAPLLLILLLHDLRSGERAAGRLILIESSAGKGWKVWYLRSVLRLSGLFIALLIPLWVGGSFEGTSTATLAIASASLLAYLTFWAIVVHIVAKPDRTSSANLTYLTGVWLLVCAIVPAILTLSVNSSIRLPQGAEIILTQREAVNDAWDLPKEDTMRPFLARHPEWAEYSEVERPFEYKWYYAFQQVGDQTAEPLSKAYREGRLQRDNRVAQLSIISPATLIQRQFEKLAGTDMRASLAYEQRVRDFHAELRHWHYPKLFEGQEYKPEAAYQLPLFVPGR